MTTKPRTMIKFHRTLLILWSLALPVSLLLRESNPWIVVMSHYTILVGHWSGWDASRAEEKAAAIKKEMSGEQAH